MRPSTLLPLLAGLIHALENCDGIVEYDTRFDNINPRTIASFYKTCSPSDTFCIARTGCFAGLRYPLNPLWWIGPTLDVTKGKDMVVLSDVEDVELGNAAVPAERVKGEMVFFEKDVKGFVVAFALKEFRAFCVAGIRNHPSNPQLLSNFTVPCDVSVSGTLDGRNLIKGNICFSCHRQVTCRSGIKSDLLRVYLEASVDKAEYTRLLRDNTGQDPAELIAENKAGLGISIDRLKYTTYGGCPTKVPP